MTRTTLALYSALVISLLFCASVSAQKPSQLDLTTATIADFQAAFEKGTLTSEKLVQLYLARIDAYDKKGPNINAIIAVNSQALVQARALDAERKAGKVRGPLHGIPFSLKDNINTFDMPTTAGSYLLAGSIPPADAFIVKKLRAAGAILLSKDNTSEFASGGGSVRGGAHPDILKAGAVPQGYSSIGGQTKNPHNTAHGPLGSSGGTGADIAAAFAQFGLGTDTIGSVRNPSAANGVVGMRPSLGLLSREGLVPMVLSLDTPGPMARSVHDIAVVLGVMAGADPNDKMTQLSVGKSETDYTKFLKVGSLKGARIGIARDFMGTDPETNRIVEHALATLKKLGAVIVDPVRFPEYMLGMMNPIQVLMHKAEFKAQVADYLKTLKPGYPRTLDELVAKANDPKSGYLDRSPEKAFALRYTAALALDINDPVYLAAKNDAIGMMRSITNAIFAKHQLDAIIYPTVAQQAPVIQPQNVAAARAALPAGEAALRAALASGTAQTQPGGVVAAYSPLLIASFNGFPELVIPAGMTKDGLPITLSMVGAAFNEPKLLGYGYDFEQATKARVLPKHTPALPGEKMAR
jgi:amidase